jgi:flagellar FliL protein
MAEEELELDVNESKGGSKKMIIIIVAILLLNGIGIGTWLFLSGGDNDKSTSDADKKEVELAPIKYLTLVPEFIVNFGPDSKVRYLQVDLQISTRDEAALATVETYRPVIRNDILVLLSGAKFEDLQDRAGKEALQKELLATINKVVASATHVTPEHEETNKEQDKGHSNEEIKGPIENVYFTSFIMQ